MRRFVLTAGLAWACLFATNALALDLGEGTITHVKLTSAELPSEAALRRAIVRSLFDMIDQHAGWSDASGHFDAKGGHTSAEKDRHCVMGDDPAHARLAEIVTADLGPARVRVIELASPGIEKRGDAHWATFPSSVRAAREGELASAFIPGGSVVSAAVASCASFDGTTLVRAARISVADPKDGVRRVMLQSKD